MPILPVFGFIIEEVLWTASEDSGYRANDLPPATIRSIDQIREAVSSSTITLFHFFSFLYIAI